VRCVVERVENFIKACATAMIGDHEGLRELPILVGPPSLCPIGDDGDKAIPIQQGPQLRDGYLVEPFAEDSAANLS
jgi:hypothetical protein